MLQTLHKITIKRIFNSILENISILKNNLYKKKTSYKTLGNALKFLKN